MDEYMSKEETNQLLKEHGLGETGRSSTWRDRMEKIEAGETLVLYPENSTKAWSLTSQAHQYANKRGSPIRTKRLTIDGQLKLFIWLAKEI